MTFEFNVFVFIRTFYANKWNDFASLSLSLLIRNLISAAFLGAEK